MERAYEAVGGNPDQERGNRLCAADGGRGPESAQHTLQDERHHLEERLGDDD